MVLGVGIGAAEGDVCGVGRVGLIVVGKTVWGFGSEEGVAIMRGEGDGGRRREAMVRRMLIPLLRLRLRLRLQSPITLLLGLGFLSSNFEGW